MGGFLVVVALGIVFIIDLTGAPRPVMAPDMPYQWVQPAARGVAIGFAVVGAWLVTGRRPAAMIGAGAAAGLVVAGFVWPISFLGVVAWTFGWPILAVLVLRVGGMLLEGRRPARGRPARAMMDDPSWRDPVARSLWYRR